MPNDRSDSDRTRATGADQPLPSPPATKPRSDLKADRMLCDRCATEMFRMHAVWRCPACGYKTDCCGW